MVVGIGGKYCTGKSEAASFLKELGFFEIDLDGLGHRALKERSDEVARRFGPEVLDISGEVDREKLGRVVFGNYARLKALETILHPVMRQIAIDLLNGHSGGNVVINGALLFPMGLASFCDFVLWFRSPFFSRFKRALKRDKLSAAGVVKRFWTQRKLSPQPSLNGVDIYYVDNSGSMEKLRNGVALVLSKRGIE